MTVDLLHNKIVKETITEAFEKSVNENLIPKLYALYSTSLEGVQMYEDYLAEDFNKDGYWYYPLTVLIAGINAVIWIKWDVSDVSLFEGGNPYAYSGDGIDFIIADDVPLAFKNALDGRANYFEGGCVKTNVATDAPSVSILIGKYSQTFIDEMTRQITAVIEKACGVSGIESSSIELDFVFAPNTYMEHTSENVTYRRLLISAKGCAPRDFWIKWTRLNSSVAFGVNDNVTSDEIVFELGEDVPHKTREKEYRFLVYGNSEKYRVAMGRKNITEWRELIKRAVKRGELSKTTTELEKEAHVAEVSDKLSEILEKYGMAIPAAPETEVRGSADIANEALRMAVLGDAPEATAAQEEPARTETEETVSEATELEVTEYESAESEATEPEAEESDETESEVAEQFVPVEEEAAEAGEAESDEDTIFAESEEQTEEESEDGISDSEGNEELEEEDNVEAFSFAGLDISDESAAEEDDDFDFDKEHEQFEMNIPEQSESSLADILADFMPKDDEDEDIAEDADEEQSVSDAIEIEETENAVYEIVKETGAEDNDTEDSSDGYAEAELQDMTAAMDAEEISDELADDSEITEAEEEFYEDAPADQAAPAVDIEAEIERAKAEVEAEYLEKLNAMSEELKRAKAEAESANKETTRSIIIREKLESVLNAERLAAADLRTEIEKQKFAIEQVRKLIDEAASARMLAEAETARIRAEYEELKRENVGLVEAARMAEEACAAAEEKSRICEEKLEEQIELFEKEKIRQKNLFVEAARQAKEESDRTEAELAEAEELRRIEEARLNALRAAEEDRIRAEEEALEQKQRAEEEARRRLLEAEERKRSIEQRAYEARLRMEARAREAAEARAASSAEYARIVPVAKVMPEESVPYAPYAAYAPAEEPESTPALEVIPEPVINYTYTSKIVRLLFKRAMDPNITVRIHELISEALTEFGKSNVYMKVKAGITDNSTVVLNFVEFPEEESQLLVDIINYLGHADLGIYKIILE